MLVDSNKTTKITNVKKKISSTIYQLTRAKNLAMMSQLKQRFAKLELQEMESQNMQCIERIQISMLVLYLQYKTVFSYVMLHNNKSIITCVHCYNPSKVLMNLICYILQYSFN